MVNEITSTGRIVRDPNFMYYVHDGGVYRVRRKQLGVPSGLPELVIDCGFEMDTEYIYFVDKNGDVARARRNARLVRKGALNDDHDDDDDDDRATEVPPVGPGETTDLLYTLFPELEVPEGTQDIRLIQDEATRIFEGINEFVDLDQLTPRQLEELLAETFNREGYESHLTPPAKDGGRDVIAVLPGPLPCLVVAEAKKMRLVKPMIVQAMYGVQYRDKAHMGLVATTGRFSETTRRMVQRTWGRLVSLKDGSEFLDWIQRIKSGGGMTGRRLTPYRSAEQDELLGKVPR